MINYKLIILSVAFPFVYLHFHVFIHELGHFTAAKLLKFTQLKVRIGIGVTLYKNSWLTWNLLPFGGGLSLKENIEDSPGKYVLLSLTGVAASFFMAIILNTIWWLSLPDNLLFNYFFLCTFMLLYVDLTNLVPVKTTNGGFSDGAVFLTSLKLWSANKENH